MVLELAILEIKQGQSKSFEKSFELASKIIEAQKGYINHELKKSVENKDKYLLMVNWETLEDHETGFRTSEDYQQWKTLLHRYYDPFPVVEHFV